MEQAALDALVQKLTIFAKEYPEKYKFRVLLLAILGYGYVVLIVALLLLSLAALSYFAIVSHHPILLLKFIIGLGALTLIVLSALWVRLTPPQGIPLSRKQAPALFALLDTIRKRLNAPKIHQVLLDDQFNACIVQCPRLGIFGWQKNYLVIGLPLMHALSPAQFTAVLAHEYGHLSGAHGKFGAWIYRIRHSWQQLIGSLAVTNNWGMKLFKNFFNWYIPYFSAYSFVLARANEYEADRAAAEIAGARNMAGALILLEIQGQFLGEKFWTALYKLADKNPEPPALFPLLPDKLRQAYGQQILVKQWFNTTLNLTTNTADTHPALQDRLIALGESATIPAPVTKTAAEELFTSQLVNLQAQINQQWQGRILADWKERYEYIQKTTQQLQSLQEKDSQNALTPDELLQMAQYAEKVQGNKAAFPVYKRLVNVDDAELSTLAYYHLGRILLENQQEKGVACLEKAVQQDVTLSIIAYPKIIEFFQKQQMPEKIPVYQQLLDARMLLEQQAQEERQQVKKNEKFLPHDLNLEQVAALAKQFAEDRSIKQVFIARKEVKYLPETPVYVMGIKRTFALRSITADEIFIKALIGRLRVRYFYILFVFNRGDRNIEKCMRKVANNLVYDKARYAKEFNVPAVKTPEKLTVTPTPRRVSPVWLVLLICVALLAGLYYTDNPIKTQLTEYIDESMGIPRPEVNKSELIVTAHQTDTLETFRFSHALSYDKRLANGLQIAISQYSALFLPNAALTSRYSVKQMDEWRYQAIYQVQQGRVTKEYPVTLSTKATEINKSLNDLAAVMAKVAHDFPTQHVFGDKPFALDIEQLTQELDYTKIFTRFSEIERALRAGKNSAESLLSVSELWSWLAFFKMKQSNKTLSDSLATQATSMYLLAQAFKKIVFVGNYQQGLLLLALDYPAMALTTWQAQASESERELRNIALLQAFIKNDVATLKQQEKPLNLYLLTRAYESRFEYDVSYTYGEKLLEKAPRYLLGVEYAVQEGSIGMQRALTSRYFVMLLKKQIELMQVFFKVPLSTPLESLITVLVSKTKEQPPLASVIALYQQQLGAATQLAQTETLFSGELLRQLIDLDMQHAINMWYSLEAHVLARRSESEKILEVVKNYYPNSAFLLTLQMEDNEVSAHGGRTEKMMDRLDPDSLDNYALHAVIHAFSVWSDQSYSRPKFIAWLDRYRQSTNPNAEGLRELYDIYQRLKYKPLALSYLSNAEQINPYNPQLWKDLASYDHKGGFIAKAKNALGETYPFFLIYGDWAHDQKKDAEAIDAYRQAIIASPSIYHSYQRLSKFYIKNKQYLDAIALMERFLNDNEESLSSYSALSKIGDIQLLQQDYPAAYKTFSVSRQSGQGNGLSGFAKASEKLGKPAEELFKALADRYVTSGPSVVELGLFYLRQGQVDKAATAFEKYSEYQYLCYYCESLIDYYQQNKLPDTSLEMVTRIKEGTTPLVIRLNYLAKIYRTKGLHKEAVVLLKRLATNTENPRENRPYYFSSDYIEELLASGVQDVRPMVEELIEAYKKVNIGMLEPLAEGFAQIGLYDLAFMVDKVLYLGAITKKGTINANLMRLAISWRFGSRNLEDKLFVEKALAEASDPNNWARQKMEALLGNAPMESLLPQATDDIRRNEIYYFLGGMAAAEGQHEKAITLLLISLATNSTDNLEYSMAYGLLARLVEE